MIHLVLAMVMFIPVQTVAGGNTLLEGSSDSIVLMGNSIVPVEGLVRTYQRPYSVFDREKKPNAHEALHSEDYCMARYGDGSDKLLLGDQSQ